MNYFPAIRHITLPSIAIALAALLGSCSEKASAPVVELRAIRDFGYTVGSLVEHRVTVDLPPGAVIDPKLLPNPGPVTDGLDLRTIRWSMSDGNRLTLQLTYLILQGVKTPEPTTIPPLTLSIRHGDGITELHTPEWPFTLMPVIPPGIPDDKIELRDMQSLTPVPTGTERWMLTGSLLAAAVCAFLTTLRRGLWPMLAAPPPFTAALRAFRQPSFSMNPVERYDTALKRIHRAIDETAGIAVFPTDLPEFLEQHPGFKPLGSEFEEFFESSQRHFFAATDHPSSNDLRWHKLVEFCSRCARAERGLR